MSVSKGKWEKLESTHLEQSGAAVGGGQLEVVANAWETEAALLEKASVGITKVLGLGLRQYIRSSAMNNNTAATTPKPAVLSAMSTTCAPAATTCCNAVYTTARKGGSCTFTTVRSSRNSPPGTTAGHRSFALFTEIPSSKCCASAAILSFGVSMSLKLLQTS